MNLLILHNIALHLFQQKKIFFIFIDACITGEPGCDIGGTPCEIEESCVGGDIAASVPFTDECREV